MTASLLLLASLLGTGPVPAPPVPTPIAVGHRYQLPATTAATRRAAALGALACRRGRMNSQTGVLLASLLALGAGVAAVVIVLMFGQAVV